MSSSNSQEVTARKSQKPNGKSTSHPIAEVKVKPRERFPLVLGNFNNNDAPVGFLIELSSDVQDTFMSQVVILDTAVGRKFVTYLTNSGKKAVNATVWQL